MIKQKKGAARGIGIFILIVGIILTVHTLSHSQVSDGKKPAGIIRGRIMDYETLKPLVGVSITILDSEWSARSDALANFKVPHLESSSLVPTVGEQLWRAARTPTGQGGLVAGGA